MSAFVEAFSHQQFAPAGVVEGSGVMQEAASLLDYVFRELDAAYGKNLLDELQADEKVVPLNRVVAQNG